MSLLVIDLLYNFQEMVGKFNADFYYLNGLTIESRKRREHLSEEDLQKNKAIMESFTKGSGTHSFDEVWSYDLFIFSLFLLFPSKYNY